MNRENSGCLIDLHAHLDGSVTVDIAKKLAALQNIALPTDKDDELLALLSVPESCESLNDFLQCFDLPGKLMQTLEGLKNAVTLVLENMAADGVIYAELRFAPQFHTLDGMTQEEAVQAAIAGLKDAPIPANLILCCMRGEGNEKENEETMMLAKQYLVEDHGVTAMDLAGQRHCSRQRNISVCLKRQRQWESRLLFMRERQQDRRVYARQSRLEQNGSVTGAQYGG